MKPPMAPCQGGGAFDSQPVLAYYGAISTQDGMARQGFAIFFDLATEVGDRRSESLRSRRGLDAEKERGSC